MKKIHYSWLILAIGIMVVFGALGLGRFGYSIVLPAMQSDLGIDNTQTGILATANLIGYLLLSVIGGAMATRYGPRIVISVGLAIAGLGMLLTGLANSFATVALWRALTGIGGGASNVPVMGLMSAWFAQKRRGLATGIAAGGSSIALIITGPTVPRIIAAYGDKGWHISWFIFGGAVLLIAIAGAIILRNSPYDIGLKPLGSDGGPLPDPHKEKIRWSHIYSSVPVWHLGLVYFAFGFSYIIYMTFFVKSLVAEGGYTQASAGNLFMVMGWFSLLCGLIWGTVSDTIGRKRALIIVYLIQSVAFSIFAVSHVPAGFAISAILFGLTAWSIPAIMAAACGDVLGSRLAPAALGFITLFFGIGQAIGPSIAGAIADASNSFYPAFLLAGGVSFLGAIGSLLIRPSGNK